MSEEFAHSPKEPGYVPDLMAKLRYLLKERPGEYNDNGTRRLVETQTALADAVRKDPARVSEWKHSSIIPDLGKIAPRIAEVFTCDEQSFRRDDYVTFVEKIEGRMIGWAALVAGADVAGTIKRCSPAEPVIHARKAGAAGTSFEDENTPILPLGAAFKVTLPVPRLKQHGSSGMLHVLLFNGDADGYINWVPQSRENPAFRGIATVKSVTREIALPSNGGELRVGDKAHGDHDIVLVVSQEPLPERLGTELRQDLRDATLQPSLDKLAHWLAPRMGKGTAGITRRTFFVGLGE